MLFGINATSNLQAIRLNPPRLPPPVRRRESSGQPLVAERAGGFTAKPLGDAVVVEGMGAGLAHSVSSARKSFRQMAHSDCNASLVVTSCRMASLAAARCSS
uniref:Uncharacterized protein n=1 Tax=Setaria italica TaxID=4555 RepID=K4AH24_SETIT